MDELVHDRSVKTEYLRTLPKVDPRDEVCRTARLELDEFLDGWAKSHKLTSAELHSILAHLQASRLDQLIRIERREDR